MAHIKLKSLLNERRLTEAPQWSRTLTLDQLLIGVWYPGGNLTKGTRISNETWNGSPVIEIDVKAGTFDNNDKIAVKVQADRSKGAEENFKSSDQWGIYQQNPTESGAGGHMVNVNRMGTYEDIKFIAGELVPEHNKNANSNDVIASNYKVQPLYIDIPFSNIAEAETDAEGRFVIKILFAKNTVMPAK